MTSSNLRRFARTAAVAASIGLGALLGAQTASELSSQAKTAYDQKQYAKSAELYIRAHKLNAKDTLSLYNGACSFALAGQKDEAFAALDELAASGYNNPERLKEDTDFASLLNDARWNKLLAKVGENAKKNPPKARWKKPYQVLEAPTSAADAKTHLGAEVDAVWLEGDVLTFAHKSSAAQVQLSGGVQEPMKRLPGTDIWIIQVKMPGWEKAFVTYSFIESGKFAGMKLWKGSQAPELPQKAKTLQGQVIERKFHSDALGEDRPLFIYLPPNAPNQGLPAVFLADGGACKSYAAVLEPLILAHKVRPCAIVGIESGGYRGDRNGGYDPSKDFRAKEYVPGEDADRFDRHLKFFTDEVGAYVAKEFGISTKREDRAVTGFSNGGAFSAAVAFRKPEFFGTSMPLSLGVPPADPKPATPLPRMFFAGGALESFGFHTNGVYEQVKGWGVESSMDLYIAGHDPAMWELAFSKLMPKAFPG
jgi:enterochelin esterase-like enzyme